MSRGLFVAESSKRIVLAWMLSAFYWLASIDPAWAAVEGEARDVVESAGNRMIELIGERRAELARDPRLLHDLVEEVLVPHFDFQVISRLVLGKYWRTASPGQRVRFTEAFKDLLVRSYGTAWLEYEGEEIRFLPERPSSRPDRVVVRVELIDPYGAPVGFAYSLHNTTGKWLVYDVAVDGVSLLANYRATVPPMVKSRGLDQTIAEIESRNAKATTQ